MNLATCTSTEELMTGMERQIMQRTWGRVHQLRIEQDEHGIAVRGCTPSYYVKQLAIQAVLDSLADEDSRTVRFDLQVQTAEPCSS